MGFLFKLPKHALSVCPGAWLGKGWEELLPRHPPHSPWLRQFGADPSHSLRGGICLHFIYFLQKSHHTLQFHPFGSYKNHITLWILSSRVCFVKNVIIFYIQRPLNFSLPSLYLLCSQDSASYLWTLRVLPWVDLSGFAPWGRGSWLLKTPRSVGKKGWNMEQRRGKQLGSSSKD